MPPGHRATSVVIGDLCRLSRHGKCRQLKSLLTKYQIHIEENRFHRYRSLSTWRPAEAGRRADESSAHLRQHLLADRAPPLRASRQRQRSSRCSPRCPRLASRTLRDKNTQTKRLTVTLNSADWPGSQLRPLRNFFHACALTHSSRNADIPISF